MSSHHCSGFEKENWNIAFQMVNTYLLTHSLRIFTILSGAFMKRHILISILIVISVYLCTTGFQCGSAEMTTARLAMQQGQWSKAEESLLKEVAKNDKNEEAWFELGRVRWNMAKYKEANEAFARAQSISDVHKNEIGAFRLRFWQDNINAGVTSYNTGLRLTGSKDSASYADAAFHESVTKFNSAVEAVPDSALGYYLLGAAHAATRDNAEAEKAFKGALAARPGYRDAIRMLGTIYQNRADDLKAANDEAGSAAELRKAAALFEDAHKIYPEDVDYTSKLISIYQTLGEEQKAVDMVQAALAKDPNKREYVYVYGEMLLKRGQFQESIDQLKKSIQMKDTVDVVYTSANLNLGIAYTNWGVALRDAAVKKAEADEKAGKKVAPDISYQEKYKLALPYFEKAVELNPNDAKVWDQLAKLYTTLNMKDKAKLAYDKIDSLLKGK